MINNPELPSVYSWSPGSILGFVAAMFIVVFVATLAVFRYYRNLRQQSSTLNENSYSVSRCWRRQLPSNSFDQVLPLSDQDRLVSDSQTNRIIKNSFSWPEAVLLHHQQQQQHSHLNPSGKCDSSSTISSSSLSTSSTSEQITEPASLTFSLRWNEENKSLLIRVISARNLTVTRRHRSSTPLDSYIRLELISNDRTEEFPIMRTHIVKKNSHPIYDELFEYSNLEANDGERYSLRLTILTYDTFTRDEILGEVLYSVDSWNSIENSELTVTRDIAPRHLQFIHQSLGQMLISLCYQPADSSITLIVLKASNLPRLDSRRLINPYFKIYMFYKQQRLMKKRSTIKRTTQSPVYNECFIFQIPDNDIFNIHFDIILFDFDHQMKHEPIGMITLGKSDDPSRSYWTDVCHRQSKKQMAQWYPLKALTKFNY